MPGLQIPNPRERVLVGAADLVVRPLRWLPRPTPPAHPVRRVLLLRLERIGDLLMVLDAIADARSAWPTAEVDLAVGSWNVPLARLIPGISHLHTIDVPWLARDERADGWGALIRHAWSWRQRRYDLVVNFEPDIRSNLLAWLSGGRRRYGYWTGGGGSFLTDAHAYVPTSHVSVNARALIAAASDERVDTRQPLFTNDAAPRLVPPAEAVRRAASLLGHAARPLVGVHASGGRESKQWHLDRFADVARQLARDRGATIVLTGSDADRPLVQAVADRLAGVPGVPVINVAGAVDVVELAAVLAELDVLVTGDTGPMHLAAAMGTPIVALFGPSDPRRYGPLSSRQRVLRVDLPCSPCGQVRLPPERCRGHVPECMDSIQTGRVVAAALELLDERGAVRQTSVN